MDARNSVKKDYTSAVGEKSDDVRLKEACFEIYKDMISGGCNPHSASMLFKFAAEKYVKNLFSDDPGDPDKILDKQTKLVNEIVDFHNGMNKKKKYDLSRFVQVALDRGDDEAFKGYEKVMLG